MPDVIFARPRDVYDSYTDLMRLITLSGFPLIYIDEIDADSDNVYIFSTPSTHWHDGIERHGWDNPRARIIYYNIEWYTDVDYRAIPGVELWCADKWYAERYGMKYVPLGSHPDLPGASVERCPKVYDLATLMYVHGRREGLINQMISTGLRMSGNAWGGERHEKILHSAAFLHIHQWDYAPCVPPQRFALAAAYRKPVICENAADRGLFAENHGVLWCDYQHMSVFAKQRSADLNLLQDCGETMFHVLCEEYSFRKNVERAL